MDAARHLEILRTEGDLIAGLPAEALDAAVPTLDGWTVERVVRHTGKVHRWAASFLALPPGAGMDAVGPTEGLPAGPDCLAAYRDSLESLLATLAERDPADPIATFAGEADVAWWMRRQAQEVSVHRVDATDAVAAAGGPTGPGLAADGAADGIDEWARFFLATRWSQRNGALPDDLQGRTIHIHGTDDPAPADGAEWLLRLGPAGVEVEATHAKGDVALRGPAESLLLALWRRRPLTELDVIGDADVAHRLLDVARF